MSGREELYEKLYHKMFNEVTDTIERLIKLQQDAEEEYLKHFDEEDEKRKKFKIVKKEG